MIEHYVTLFDSLFLPQALALHASLQRHAGAHRLWMLCIDDESFDLLQRLGPSDCQPMRLADLETPALLAVRPTRSRGEYCWTLTPFAPDYVFDADPSVDRVTYLDADVWFRSDPRPIFAEFEASNAQILITRHGYAAEYDQSATAGKYCVQFTTFTRDGGRPARRWWQDKCIDWCFARYEDGKFGDQKYLDDWPERFGSDVVHVLQRQEFALAPWNATRFPYSDGIFFHFHGLRIAPSKRIDLSDIYALPQATVEHVYEPYLVDLRKAIATLETLGFAARPQSRSLGLWRRMRRAVAGVYRARWHVSPLHVRRY